MTRQREALQAAQRALGDYKAFYKSVGNMTTFFETRARIRNAGGTLAYITSVQAKIKAALK